MRERLCDQLPGNVLQADLLIPQRERVAKIPADGTQNELGFGLSPLEDRRLGRHSDLFRLPAPVNFRSCNTLENKRRHGEVPTALAVGA